MSPLSQSSPCVLVVGLSLCLASGPTTAPTTRQSPLHYNEIVTRYKIVHFLSLAVELQELDEAGWAQRLREIAEDWERGDEAIILCRMLLEARDGAKVQRPPRGLPRLIGRGTIADWPLDPIAIYRDVPIAVAYGYSSTGPSPHPAGYVKYCLTECKWRETKYLMRDAAEVKQIVEDFISAKGVRDHIDRQFLRAQAKE